MHKQMLKKLDSPPTPNHYMFFCSIISFQCFHNARFRSFYKVHDVTKRGLESQSGKTLTFTHTSTHTHACMEPWESKRVNANREFLSVTITYAHTYCTHTHKHISMTMLDGDWAAYIMVLVSESEEAAGYDPFICMLITDHIGPGTSRKISP